MSLFVRSLVANLGAANYFTIDHLNDPKNQKYIENAKIFYTAVSDHLGYVCHATSVSFLDRDFFIQFVLKLSYVYVNMLIRMTNYFVLIYQHHLSVKYSVIDWWKWCNTLIIYLAMKQYEYQRIISVDSLFRFRKHEVLLNIN